MGLPPDRAAVVSGLEIRARADYLYAEPPGTATLLQPLADTELGIRRQRSCNIVDKCCDGIEAVAKVFAPT